ncbi:MAG: carbon-nitrogen hydrolase family protein [Rhodobacteraceae bacterium]|nr:carbon-nitrogen hydrolase family protein [Paracoccaceae bacterium]
MQRLLNIACLQTSPKPDFDQALAETLGFAQAAVTAGAQFIALPEYCGGLATDNGALAPPFVPENEHPVLLGLRDFSAANKIWMLIGSVAVTGSNGKIINRSLLLDDVGMVRARYDKIHLFDIQLSENEVYCESERVEPGNTSIVADTPFGRMGLSICYDLRFPHLYRDMAQAGAEILFVPAAFTKTTGRAHWHVLNKARAIENGAFVVAPCAVGPITGGGESYGHSLIVSPWGEVVSDGGERTGVVQAEIDLNMVAATRSRIPSLIHDRPFQLVTYKNERDVA